jgi:hypothetical protein
VLILSGKNTDNSQQAANNSEGMADSCMPYTADSAPDEASVADNSLQKTARTARPSTEHLRRSFSA